VYCKNCNDKIEKGQQFCTNCGTKAESKIIIKKRYIISAICILGIAILLKIGIGFILAEKTSVNNDAIETIDDRDSEIILPQQKQSTAAEQIIRTNQESIKEEWIYFDDINDSGKIFRMKKDGSEKMTLPITNVEKWYIYEDKILYSTLRDWSKVEASYSEMPTQNIFFINQLYMMNLDGTEQVLLADESSPLHFSYEGPLAISFSPFFIKKDKIYLEVTSGIPETDAMSTSIYVVNKDGKDFRELSEKSYFNMSEYYISDKYLYFSENNLEQLSPLCRIDLTTGECKEVGNATALLGEYKGKLYYTEQFYNETETNMSLYKLSESTFKTELVCEISKSAYLTHAKIINNKLYFSYYPEDKYEYKDLIKEELNLDTRKLIPITPEEENYLYMSSEYKKMKDKKGWIYYAPYDEENFVTKGIYKMNNTTHENKIIQQGVNVSHMQIVELGTAVFEN